MILQEQKLDEFGHVRLGGIGEILGREIEKRTGYETRVSRAGTYPAGEARPPPFDRVLGTRFGVKAVELVKERNSARCAPFPGIKSSLLPWKGYRHLKDRGSGILRDRQSLLWLKKEQIKCAIGLLT